MDLTAAEGIADLVAAETAAQRRQALRQAEGGLAALYEGWTDRLTRLLARQEAFIEFETEDEGSSVEEEAQDEDEDDAVFVEARDGAATDNEDAETGPPEYSHGGGGAAAELGANGYPVRGRAHARRRMPGGGAV